MKTLDSPGKNKVTQEATSESKSHTSNFITKPNCDHSLPMNYARETNASYFNANYLKSHIYPKKCCGEGCNAKFGKNYKVGSKHEVWACMNAIHTNHACVHAYCDTCYNKFSAADDAKQKQEGNTTGRRTRHSSRQVS